RVDDRPADERRVGVDLLVRDALATAARAREASRVVERADQPDEDGPERETPVQRLWTGRGDFGVHERSIGFGSCVTSRRTRRTRSWSTCGRWWSKSLRPGWNTRPRATDRRQSRERARAREAECLP